MKRDPFKYHFTCLIVLLACALSACKDNRMEYPALENHWVLVNQSSGDKPMTLTFGEDELEVRHASLRFPPFYNSSHWDYWVEADTLLVIGYSETTDYDDYTYSEYVKYELPFELSADGNHLTLWFGGKRNPFYPNAKVYQFLKR